MSTVKKSFKCVHKQLLIHWCLETESAKVQKGEFSQKKPVKKHASNIISRQNQKKK